jgi:hypothetical protein
MIELLKDDLQFFANNYLQVALIILGQLFTIYFHITSN